MRVGLVVVVFLIVLVVVFVGAAVIGKSGDDVWVAVVVVARWWRPDGGGGGGVASVAKLNDGVKGQMTVENDCLLAIIVDIICKKHAAVLRSECHHKVGREQPHSTCVPLRSSTANNSVIHWRPFNPRCFRSLVKCRPNVVCIQIFGGQHASTISIRNAKSYNLHSNPLSIQKLSCQSPRRHKVPNVQSALGEAPSAVRMRDTPNQTMSALHVQSSGPQSGKIEAHKMHTRISWLHQLDEGM